ncbi:MAG: CRISPR-associated protein Csh2 family [Defluviitaleaceae bacterium]|jgi:CRISPR-associated protein Csh2|nr:CRISPR-associated protein Csh2 family [Defluviitaleaceae bacterium]
MAVIKNRSELLFLYDVTDANPNGDPLDENKPRIDEETGINIVTDVRFKRNIRDYLHDYKNEEIFIVGIRDEKGNRETKENRLSVYKDNQELISRCIDVRLFGATTAVKGKTMTLTGPVQFKFGRSLHKVDIMYIKGTTVMPSKQDKTQGTFTEKYVLPYSLIGFYGIINENIAASQGIDLTEEDIELLLEGMWNGTKNIMSNSKMGHVPRLLLQVIYKEKNYQIGELDKRIRWVSEKQDQAVRDIADGEINITDLVNSLKKHQDKIQCIRYKVDDRVKLVVGEDTCSIESALEDLPLEELAF